MGYIEAISDEIAKILIREGLDYNQTKAVFKAARQKAALKPMAQKKGSVERLTLEEELRFIEAAYAQGGRTGLMMQTLLETGSRVSEFIALRVDDISFAERLVVIREGKGGKRRDVPMRRELAQLLQLHLAKRRSGPLFQSREKPYIYSRQRIGQMVREIAKAAGINKRIYPHLLRHTMATRLLNSGMSMHEVQRFLGHDDISSTQIYAQSSLASLQKRFDDVTSPMAKSYLQQLEKLETKESSEYAASLLLERHPELVAST